MKKDYKKPVSEEVKVSVQGILCASTEQSEESGD